MDRISKLINPIVAEQKLRFTVSEKIKPNSLGEPPVLFQAVLNGEVANVKRLIAKGANVNAPLNFGETLLMLACIKGNLGVIELLLRNGAWQKINQVDETGYTALTRAVAKGWHKVVQLLLSYGADAMIPMSPLALAEKAKNYKIIQLLLIKDKKILGNSYHFGYNKQSSKQH